MCDKIIWSSEFNPQLKMSNTYESIEYTQFGEPNDVLQLVLKPTDEIEQIELGDGEMIVRNLAGPIDPSTQYFIRGLYEDNKPFPKIAGYATVSVIHRTGPNTKYQVGTRVLPKITEGAFTTYLKLHQDDIYTIIPNDIDITVSCQAAITGITVMAITELHDYKDKWVLQTASGSVLGRAVIQVSNLKGINLISVIRRHEQAKELEELGAKVVVFDGKNQEEVKEKIKEITGGKGVDYVFDCVAGDTGTFFYNILNKTGLFYTFGLLSEQPTVFPEDKENNPKESFLQYSVWYESLTPEQRKKSMDNFLNLLSTKKVNLRHDAVYEYKDYKKAFELAKTGKKIILVPTKSE